MALFAQLVPVIFLALSLVGLVSAFASFVLKFLHDL